MSLTNNEINELLELRDNVVTAAGLEIQEPLDALLRGLWLTAQAAEKDAPFPTELKATALDTRPWGQRRREYVTDRRKLSNEEVGAILDSPFQTKGREEKKP